MIVLFINGSPLLLSAVSRNKEDGTLKGGFVENGSWDLKIRNGKAYAYGWEGGRHATSWPIEKLQEIEVPKEMRTDPGKRYNEIIHWAEKQLTEKQS